MSRKRSCLALPLALVLVFCLQQAGSPARAGTADPTDTVAAPRPKSKPSKEVIGWVMRMDAPNNIDARFALTDKSGHVGYYLRPSAGVQLSRYVNIQVRLRGTSITPPDESTPVLAVDRIGPPDVALGPKDSPSRSAARPVNRRKGQSPAAPEPTNHDIRQTSAMQEQDEVAEPSDNNFGDVALTPIPEIEESRAEPMNYSRTNHGGCGGCNRPSCPTCCNPCGPAGNFWVRAEYLYWWSAGMHLPPLVTTGPSAAQPGYLGSPGTEILFGGSSVNGGGRSGGRLTTGMWLNPCRTIGVEGDYFALASATTNFSATSPGSPILSRPFFDVRPSLSDQNVEQVASPGVIAGTVSVNVPTQFSSAGVNLRYNLCCSSCCFSDACWPGLNGPGGCRIDFLLGYRFYRLSDGVTVNENLTALDPAGAFLVNDSFTSRNLFNGVEFGTAMQKYRGRWSLELISKLAMGNNNEVVNINGSTDTTQNGVTTHSVGGLLAQPSNIGLHQRNEFAVVPQLNGNLTYQLTPRLRAVAGYSFIYWSRVARAGDQIDTNVNSNLLPNHPPVTGPIGPALPQFVFHDSAFWAQGVNVGLDYRW